MNQNYPHDTKPVEHLFDDEFSVTYATFWQRLGAMLIDGLILAIFTLLMDSLLLEHQSNILEVIVGWLYFSLQESGSAQATLGKRALGIKVTNSQGARISFGQATGRHFGKIVSTLIIFIGFLMVLWDEKRQALHDKMASTFIVQK